VKLAVVVQCLAAVETAGLLSTTNPVTGTRDEVVMDASPGSGEAVVSGHVAPDQYVLRKGQWGWRIVERRLGRREVIIRPRSGGGTDCAEASAPADLAAVPDRTLRQLARLSAATQLKFGAPQGADGPRPASEHESRSSRTNRQGAGKTRGASDGGG
jgi:phosphoenolpyruvate synthase/pyruvate phosphate dikinase